MTMHWSPRWREWTCVSEAASDTASQAGTANTPVPMNDAAAVYRRRIAIARLRDFALIPAIIAIAIVGQVVNPVFLRTDNLVNVLQTMSEIAVLVLAETLVLIVK